MLCSWKLKFFLLLLLGFCFVSFDSEDTVDKICEQQFHHIDGNKVRGVVIHLQFTHVSL